MPENAITSLANRLNYTKSVAKRKSDLDFDNFNVDTLNITKEKDVLDSLRKKNRTEDTPVPQEDRLLELEKFKKLMESTSNKPKPGDSESSKVFREQYEKLKENHPSPETNSKLSELPGGKMEITDKATEIDNEMAVSTNAPSKKTLWKRYQELPPAMEYLNDKANSYLENSKLKQELLEVLEKNLDADQKILDQFKKTCNAWHQETIENAKKFHVTDPTKDTSFLTKENIEHVKKRYQGETYITGYEADSLCNRVKGSETSTKTDHSPYDELSGCHAKGKALEKETFYVKQKLADKDYLLNNCYRDKEGYQKSATKCQIEKKEIVDDVTIFKNGVEDVVNDCLDDNNRKEQKLMNQTSLTEHYEDYIQNQTKIESNLQKQMYSERHKADHAYKVLEKLEKNLGTAQELVRQCQKSKYWHQTGIANQVGIVLEVLLEVTVWPYATYNEESFLHKILPCKLGPMRRLVLTVCISIVWVMTILLVQHRATVSISHPRQEKSKRRNSWLTGSTALLMIRGGAIEPCLDPCFIEVKMASIRKKLSDLQQLVNKPIVNPNKTLQRVTFGMKTPLQTVASLKTKTASHVHTFRPLFLIFISVLLSSRRVAEPVFENVPQHKTPTYIEQPLINPSKLGSKLGQNETLIKTGSNTFKIEQNNNTSRKLMTLGEFDYKRGVNSDGDEPKLKKRNLARLNSRKRNQVRQFYKFRKMIESTENSNTNETENNSTKNELNKK